MAQDPTYTLCDRDLEGDVRSVLTWPAGSRKSDMYRLLYIL
jgi:hypothetical protein